MNAGASRALILRGAFARTFQVVAVVVLLSTIPSPGLPQAQELTEKAPQQTTPAAPAKRPRVPSVITFESSVGEVLFPHKVHMRMGCQKCHHQIHARELATPHADYFEYSQARCGVCHNEQETGTGYYGCANCHHSNPVNIADETLSAKVVVHKSCWKCHLSGTGVEASERCAFCHAKEGNDPDISQDAAQSGNDADNAQRAAQATAE